MKFIVIAFLLLIETFLMKLQIRFFVPLSFVFLKGLERFIRQINDNKPNRYNNIRLFEKPR